MRLMGLQAIYPRRRTSKPSFLLLLRTKLERLTGSVFTRQNDKNSKLLIEISRIKHTIPCFRNSPKLRILEGTVYINSLDLVVSVSLSCGGYAS
jgi:hypothetical protein